MPSGSKSSVAGVVGVTGEDGEGAVDLFGEDGAGHFMRQGDVAERQDEAGACACGWGPAVGGTDGEDEGLCAGVAKAAEVGGDVIGGKLLSAAVEEDEYGSGAGGLAVEPGEEVGLGRVGLGFAGEVSGGTGEVVGGEGSGRVGLGTGA